MMDILISETCWAHKMWNKMTSDIKLVLYPSTLHKSFEISLNVLKLVMKILLKVSCISWIRRCLSVYWGLQVPSKSRNAITQWHNVVYRKRATRQTLITRIAFYCPIPTVFFVICALHSNKFTASQEVVQVWEKLAWSFAVERVTDLFLNKQLVGSNLGLKVGYPG